MSDPTVIRKVTISNEQGMHMRPAGIFADTAAKFDSQIQVVKDDHRVDGKSVLSILTLAAEHGSQLSLEATGHDAEQAVAALVELVNSGFANLKSD